MGSPETATRRLNIAQSFNPIGCITGILLSQFFILSELNSADAGARAAMSETELAAIQQHELNAVTGTYMTLGFVLLAVMVIMLLAKMPKGGDTSNGSVKESFTVRVVHPTIYRRVVKFGTESLAVLGVEIVRLRHIFPTRIMFDALVFAPKIDVESQV